MKKAFTLTLILLMIAAMAVLVTERTHAQFDTLDTEARSLTFSLAGQNTNSTTAVTAANPIKAINGYSAVYVSRQNEKILEGLPD